MARALISQDAARERTATRLLNSSARNSYDPRVDIDWDAELVPGLMFTPVGRISLYGTPDWDRLTATQRITLSRHELASVVANGIWFETILMRMLISETYGADPTRRHVQYLLTEVADECRHSIMFARLIERIGAPAYRPPRAVHRLARALNTVARGPSRYAAVLLVEEILDRLQREAMVDETVQPLVRMVSRIHVVEESRHVTFAREEVTRYMARCGRTARAYHRAVLAPVAHTIVETLVNPGVYRSVGIAPARGHAVARANPVHRETLRWAGERAVGFLTEAGLIGGPTRRLWRRAFLIT